MALVLKDRVKETTTTTGTGTLSLAGAVAGHLSFSEIGNANTTFYCIEDKANFAWEVGIGTYTSSGSTLSRTTVLASSNANALVNFAAGNKDVFCTYPAGKAIYEDAAGDARFDSGFGSQGVAFGVRAWVNYNGTGTIAIRDSGNVASLTDNGVGSTDVNFSTNMPDTNYAALATTEYNATNVRPCAYISTLSVGSARVRILNEASGVTYDAAYVGVAIFR